MSLSSNSRCLDALAVVSDPSAKVRELERITTRKQVTPNRSARAFNPLSRDDVELFEALMSAEHCVGGFKNRDLRRLRAHTTHFRGIRQDDRRQSAKVTRILQRFHAHGRIAKIPRSRKGRTHGSGGASWPRPSRSGNSTSHSS